MSVVFMKAKSCTPSTDLWLFQEPSTLTCGRQRTPRSATKPPASMGVQTGASWFTGIARSQPDGGSFATSLFRSNHNLASNHVVGVQMKSPSQFRFWPPVLSRAETHFVRCPEGNLSVLHSRPNAQRESINAAASDAPRYAMIWRP